MNNSEFYRNLIEETKSKETPDAFGCFKECFFIDDSPYNIEGAYMCGMPGTVFHGDVEELRDNLKNAGIKIS